MARYELPDLPYDYDALEPHIDEQTMRLHHDKHHQGYVDGANSALDALEEARNSGDFSDARSVQRALSFNLSGHINHAIFWQVLAPKGEGGEPSDELANQINSDFGSLSNLEQHFKEAAGSVEGSGWGIIGWEPQGEQLLVYHAENHQNQTVRGVQPIFLVDVWEHAYYLNYQNKRGEYIDNVWEIVNWNRVSELFENAKAGKTGLQAAGH